LTGNSIHHDPTFKFINDEAAPQELVNRQTMPKDLAKQEYTGLFGGKVGQQYTYIGMEATYSESRGQAEAACSFNPVKDSVPKLIN